MDPNGEVRGSKEADLRRFNDIFVPWDEWLASITGKSLSDIPPVSNPSRLSRRERILALYRKQGRPQAHLDRVMRLVGGESPSMRSYGTKLESRFPSGVKQDWSSYL